MSSRHVAYDFFFFASRRRHTRFDCDWSSDVCSSDLARRRADGPPDPLEKWGLRLPKRPPISSGTSGRLRRLAHPTPLQSAEDSMQVSRRDFLRLTANAGAGTAIGGVGWGGGAPAPGPARAAGAPAGS